MDETVYLTSIEDSRIPTGLRIPTLKSGRVSYRSWYLPLSYDSLTMRQGLEFLSIVAAPQGQIPEIIRWTEGKDSRLVREFFYGGVDLKAHDCIHLLLGRGLLTKDEAFVIGFTMGSTNRLETLNKEIFAYIAGNYYPNAYQMDEEARRVFLDAAKLGHVCDCQPLDEVHFSPLLDEPIGELRRVIGIPSGVLQAYFRDIEKVRYPDDPASSRLETESFDAPCWQFSGEDPEVSLLQRARTAELELNRSDQHFQCRVSVMDDLHQQFLEAHRSHLENQHRISRQCFEEIRKVCGDDHEAVQRDLQEQPWEHYFAMAMDNLETVARKVLCLDSRSQWEQAGPGLEQRAWVHALLDRGGTPIDRAFCRGFFDGSADDKSTYAASLKLDVLSQIGLSLDGPYDQSMRRAYEDGVNLAFISDTLPLMQQDFSALSGLRLSEARKRLKLSTALLDEYRVSIEAPRAFSS